MASKKTINLSFDATAALIYWVQTASVILLTLHFIQEV